MIIEVIEIIQVATILNKNINRFLCVIILNEHRDWFLLLFRSTLFIIIINCHN